MEGPLALLLLFGAGVVAGTVNVIAGGGSFLTLPVLIFLGLPTTVANGTNRVALLLQNIGAVWGFSRHGVLDWRFTLRVVTPAILGATLGAWLALDVGDLAFRRLLAVLMLAVTLWTVVDPMERRVRRRTAPPRRAPGPALWLLFFAIGVYGGFIQAGVGFLLLAGTTLAGLDLVRGNAVKVLCVLAWTFATLTVFASAGQVDWDAGLAMGAGNLVGSQVGVRYTVLKGHAWVRAFLIVTILIFAVLLWLGG